MILLHIRGLVIGLVTVAAIGTVGCGPSQTVNPWALRKENSQLKAAVRQYQDQLAQSKTRADNLDADNEQLHTLLAQEQDTRRRLEDQTRLASRSPRPPAGDDYYEDEAKEFGPATGRKPAANAGRGGSAYPKTPVRDVGTGTNISGADVLRDGDAIRIRVTNTTLFDPGKATLKPGASKVLDQVASSIRRSYPGELIGIEGHTDGDPIRKSNWKDNHELSYQRARAVYDYLSTRGGVPATQLYIAAYGPNHPIASNTSSSGKAQNRRVEFVVRPGGSADLR